MIFRVFKYSLLVAAICGLQTAEAQNRQFQGGGGFRFGGGGSLESSGIRLATLDPVKKEINLDEEQAKKLEALATELRESTQGLFSRDTFQGLSEEERDKKVAENREKMQKASEANAKKAREVLKPEQLKRLIEIAFQQRVQFGIAGVFRIDEFVKEAKVTEDQKKKVEELNDELRKEAEKVSENRFEQFTWRREEGAKKYEPKFEAVLTADQKSVLAKMKGKEFDVSQLQQGFGGRPGVRPGTGVRPSGGGQGAGGRPQRPQRPGQDNN